jgi:hypothetical protein
MLVKITNGVPAAYSYTQLRRDNPQVSFPRDPSEETLAEYDVFELVQVAPPSVTATQRAEQDTPQFIANKWTQVWKIVDITAELAAQKDAQVSREVDVLFGKVLFEIVNDVRVLKGQGTITRQQFINYLRSKL